MTADDPILEAYLLIEQPRQRLGHWTQALAALDTPAAPPLAAIVARYDPTCDQAVLELSYDELALGPGGLGFVVEVALLAEVGMIQPRHLSEGERKRVITERLGRCTVEVGSERSVAGALAELVRRLREQKRAPSPRLQTAMPPLPKPPAAPKPPPPVPEPTPAAKPARAAKPTLSAKPKRAPSQPIARLEPRGEPPVLVTAAKGTRDNLPGTSRHVISRPARVATIEMAPAHVAQLTSEARGSQPLPRSTPTGSDAFPPIDDLAPDRIYARYLRSGRWVPARVGALSLKGGALLVGALPRLHDRVDVALSFASHRALVRGEVTKVSSQREAVASGAATFSMGFDLDEASRRQLTELLTAARAAKVTIKPAPPRANRRFPVEWRVMLGTPRGPIAAEALDVSTGGMFVRPEAPLELNATASFSMGIDDDGPPIAGTARVARHMGDADAAACGLAPGYGLELLDLSETDRMRWLGFVARVERRTDKRVLIGAAPERLAELQALLAACGYAVTGGTDPGALVQLASSGARPVDIAVLDAGWLQNGAAAAWVESLFSARSVPCMTLSEGDVRRARVAIDRLLDVS
jgi:hypothetical protein